MVIGSGEDHPLGLNFRQVWDYDHLQIRAGGTDLNYAFPPSTKPSPGIYMDQPEVLSGDPSPKTDYFRESRRNIYVQQALAYNQGLGPIEDVRDNGLSYNPLTCDPAYLVLEKDLLDVAAAD